MHQREQTHCKRGHPLFGENVYLYKGHRHCKECKRENLRKQRANKPKSPPKPRPRCPWQERFWRYVTPASPDECWEWRGANNSFGYGRLNRGDKNNRTIKAHRASYQIHFGIDPEDKDVCHHCDNPPCVNPYHLFLGDAKSNAEDMVRKGRSGPQNGQGLLTRKVSDEDVRNIRYRASNNEYYWSIAQDYSVTQSYISDLARGKRRIEAGGPITPYRRVPTKWL